MKRAFRVARRATNLYRLRKYFNKVLGAEGFEVEVAGILDGFLAKRQFVTGDRLVTHGRVLSG